MQQEFSQLSGLFHPLSSRLNRVMVHVLYPPPRPRLPFSLFVYPYHAKTDGAGGAKKRGWNLYPNHWTGCGCQRAHHILFN